MISNRRRERESSARCAAARAPSSTVMSAPGTNTAFVREVTATGVAIVTLDHHPVNSLSAQVHNAMSDCRDQLQAAAEAGAVKAVVLVGAGRAFCAGADISQQGAAPPVERRVTKPLDAANPAARYFEDLSVPCVVGIHGFALGGGLELALSCHYRVLAADARVGLPEVNIGILPGGQGTQRLPRLIGIDAALECITTGRHIQSAEALDFGIVDEVVSPGDDAGAAVEAAALAVAISKIGISPADLEQRKISRMAAPQIDRAALDTWMVRVQTERFGEPAPVNIVNAVKGACTAESFAAGVAIEAKNMAPLMGSPEAFALRHLFFSERAYLRGGETAAPVQSLIDAIDAASRSDSAAVVPAVPVGATAGEIERLLFPVVNDAVQLLAESDASPDDIDVAFTQGHGFPRYLGGPLWWAAALGLERLRAGLQAAGHAVAPALSVADTIEDVQKAAAATPARAKL